MLLFLPTCVVNRCHQVNCSKETKLKESLLVKSNAFIFYRLLLLIGVTKLIVIKKARFCNQFLFEVKFLNSASDAAFDFNLKVTLHVEPYESRNAENFRTHLSKVMETHAKHPAFYRRRQGTKMLPVFYVYDSYRLTITFYY